MYENYNLITNSEMFQYLTFRLYSGMISIQITFLIDITLSYIATEDYYKFLD